jgi:membrane fusion protein, multidrug efflux system
MASKVIYSAVALVGIAAASGAAWWYQRPAPSATAAPLTADAPAIGAATGASAAQTSASSAASGKPPTVEVAKVDVAQLVDDTQAVGSLRSRRGVVLRPEVSGRITQLNFTDGQRVRKGQLLVQFDDQLQLAQVQQSQAELSIAQANFKRNQELVSENFISKRSLDESAANLQVAQARLALAKATASRLKIIAPFDGIAGIRQVNVGDYLKDGADIVNVEDLEAIYVDFRLPERFQSKVRPGQTARLGIDALPGRSYTAQIQAIDPLIDANGRSIGVRGCVDNRQLQLRPGMFARVNAIFGVRENARVIPEEAIVPQGGRQFVIKLLGSAGEPKTSQRVEVKIGLRSPGKVEILDGLEVGDTVVISGQQRVQKDGTRVSVVEVGSAAGGKGTGVARSGAAPAGSPAAAAGAASAPAAAASAASGSEGKRMPASKQAASAPSRSVRPNPCGLAVASSGGSASPATSDGEPRKAAAERARSLPASRDPA